MRGSACKGGRDRGVELSTSWFLVFGRFPVQSDSGNSMESLFLVGELSGDDSPLDISTTLFERGGRRGVSGVFGTVGRKRAGFCIVEGGALYSICGEFNLDCKLEDVDSDALRAISIVEEWNQKLKAVD